jgi:mannose-6-phosphate isomerase-like protein (cupin superfamily)
MKGAMMAAAAISQTLCLLAITVVLVYCSLRRREHDMQTATIDLRTDKALAACLRVDRPVSVLAYDYASDDRVPAHEHAKAQLIYAIEGTMTVSTREGQWVLLPTRAVWVPAHTRHSIRMRSARMRTVFFDESVPPPATSCAVVSVSPLLRELILNMLQEPRSYPLDGRGAQIAALMCSELSVVQTLPLHLPWPRERHGLLGDAHLHEQPHARTALPKGAQHEFSGMAIATAAARSADSLGARPVQCLGREESWLRQSFGL